MEDDMTARKASEKPEALAPSVGVDLEALDFKAVADKGAHFVPRHPVTGEKMDCWLTVHGSDSDQYFSALDAVRHEREDVQREVGRRSPSMEDFRQGDRTLASGIVADWGGIRLGGEEVACTPENKAVVFARHRWLVEQVVAFSRDRGNFIAS